MKCKEAGCEGVKWSQLAQDKVQRWVLTNITLNLSGFDVKWI
jgi:hypothetical protein